MAIAYISHPDCAAHDMGPGHPECPERLSAINDRLIASGLDMALRHYDAPLVDDALLERVHDRSYLDDLEQRSPSEGTVWVDADTTMGPHTLRAARRAAGAVALGVDLAMAGEANRVFCGVRPPGHHAERNQAMGFCFYNNIAVGAYQALEHHGLERVAIVDFDVHHGNGTEHIVAGDDRVLFCSTFQHPFYPNSGDIPSAENVVNAPLAAGAGSDEFRMAVSEFWLPRLQAHRPQMLLVSAGFDAHLADDMAGLNLMDSDYGWVMEELVRLAAEQEFCPIVASLEGGYNLHALARSVEALLKAMLD